jgi:multicomponent Na+:H+ antiporter subunit D
MPVFTPAIPLFLAALVLALLPGKLRPPVFVLASLAALGVVVFLEPGQRQTFSFLGYELVLLRVDRLSLAFAYVFTVMAVLGGIYGFHVREAGQLAAGLVYIGSSVGVVFAGDLLTLVIFWEVMAVSSAYLIWARRTVLSYRAGIRYLLVHLAGGTALLAGVIMYLYEAQSLEFVAFEPSPATWLILLGVAVNAAIPPLHAWLADSYPEGTVTGSVLLSAYTTKTAVYVLARGFPGWEILIYAGVIMAVYGVVYAVLVNDIRRILAYHIISQVGYMVAGVGLGTEAAINGATAHAIAHILYKALLFMGAGAVLFATGKSRLTELGGLLPRMRLTFVLYMVGAFSISGFPLFSGFVSKSLITAAASYEGWVISAFLLYLASVGTFLSTGLKLPYFVWRSRDTGLSPTPLPAGMYLSMAVTAALCFVLGVVPGLLYDVLPYPVDYEPYTWAHVVEAMQLLLFTGLAFYLLIPQLTSKSLISLDTDWVYRRGAEPARVLAVSLPSWAFSQVESAALAVVSAAFTFGRNPMRWWPFGRMQPAAPVSRPRGRPRPGKDRYDPGRYRFSTGAAVFSFLLVLALLLIWGYAETG